MTTTLNLVAACWIAVLTTTVIVLNRQIRKQERRLHRRIRRLDLAQYSPN